MYIKKIKQKIKQLIMCSIMFLLLFNNQTLTYGKEEENIPTIYEVQKPLVCVKGYDYQELFEYTGYEIINSNVNFMIPGIYYVSYIELNTSQTISKKVSIIEKTEVFNNTYYDLNYFPLGESLNEATMVSSLSQDECLYLLEYAENEDNFDYILSKSFDNSLMFSKTIKSNLGGKPVSFVFYNDMIIVLGHTYNLKSGSDIYLGCFDKEGNIITETTINGDGVDIAKGMIIVDEQLFIYGNTKSTNSYFKGSRNNEDSFIMKLNAETLYPLETKVFNKLYINSLNHLVYHQGYLYGIESYVNYTKENNQLKVNLVKISMDLSEIIFEDMINSYALTDLKLKEINNRLFFLCYQFDYGLNVYTSCCYEIEENLDIYLIDKLIDYETEHMMLQDFDIDDQNKYLFLYQIYGENKGSYLKVKENNEVVMQLKVNDDNLAADKLLNDYYCFLTKEKVIVSYNYITGLNIGNEIINETTKEYGNNRLVINNETPILSKESKQEISKSSNNEYLYGEYLLTYVYKTKAIDFCYHQNIYVDPMISVKNQETYDKNLSLKFNGEGYLNDLHIESGYQIKDEGDYTFELIGKNGIKKIYQFTIDEYSKKEVLTTIPLEIVNLTFDEKKQTNIPNSNTLIIGNMERDTPSNTSVYWLLLIPLIIIPFGIVILKRVKR